MLWSAAEFPHKDIHGSVVMPRPLKGKPKPSPNWPPDMTRFRVQAHDSVAHENWDAANVMARSALQFVVRESGASGPNLKSQIDDLVAKRALHSLMGEWAHELRLLANESAHPNLAPAPPSPEDTRDILSFLDFLLYCLYDLPFEIQSFRQRRQ